MQTFKIEREVTQLTNEMLVLFEHFDLPYKELFEQFLNSNYNF